MSEATPTPKHCRIPECEAPQYCRAICKSHYMLWYRQKPEQVEKRRQYNAEHYKKNLAWYKERNKKHGLNRELCNYYAALDRGMVPETYRARSRAQHARNPIPSRLRSTKRRAAFLKRVPAWANDQAIKQIYANCPKGYHVDHIIPLQGRTVSGLHVEYNLQYLLPRDNIAKGNKF